MKPLNRLQLRGKLLVLGVLPAAILAIVLAGYFTNSRVTEMYELFQEKEVNLAVAVANISVYGVFSGDKESLTKSINSFIQDKDVQIITITDDENNHLVQVQKQNISKSDNNFIITKRPIIINTAADNDEIGELFFQNNKQSNIVGYVTLQSSLNNISQRQNEVLLNSLYITFLSLLVIAFIAYNIGKAIGKPILNLAKDVSKIKQGQYKLPVRNFSARDEISILSHGIHDMAHELETNQFRQQQKIREATKELKKQNIQLNTAQKNILKTAEAKSKFISHISHEIRTPLNGIIGFLDFIEQTPLTEEQQKLVNASIISSKNLHQIINDVLDLAQLEAGKVKIAKKTFHLKSMMENTLSTMAILATENNVIIDYQHDDALPTHIIQDPTKLTQILLNLISNAIKFSPNSTISVQLNLHKELPNQLDCSVIDKGVGISKQNHKKLFEEFTQFESSSYEKGTGLGLSITQKIIAALNGKITVKSTLGKGSTFRFNLPFIPAENNPTTASSLKATNDALETVYLCLSGINVLAADDNQINRQLIKYLFSKQNVIVDCVNDGQQAYEAAQQKKYDLMLLDLRMPFKMGHEVLDEIRSNEQQLNHSTPAVAITAHVTSGIERAMHINNFDGYLVKPIEHGELLHLACQLLTTANCTQKTFNEKQVTQNSSKQTLQTFNLQAALSSMGNNPVLVEQMMTKFLTELPNQIQTLKSELANDNAEQAADIIHNIHGSAAYCGTTLLKSCAKVLEESLRNDLTNDISPEIEKFFDQANHLITIKNDIIATIKKSPN